MSIEIKNYENNNKNKELKIPLEVKKITKKLFLPTKHVLEFSKKQRDEFVKELGDSLNFTLLNKRKEYKSNPEVLEKIKLIEEELGDILKQYFEEEKNTNISQEQKEIILEMFRRRIGNLEIKLKTIEATKEKEKRYEGVVTEFGKIKNIEEFKDILGEKDFEELTAGDFYALLKTNPEKLRNLLLSTKDGKAVNISGNWEKYKNKILKINFGKNKGLDKIIGAGDILDITKVKKVKINGIEGVRKSTPRPGYYTNSGRYLSIHDGFNIEILEIKDLKADELKEFNSAINKRFDEVRGEEIKLSFIESINREIKKDKESKKIKISYKSKVDMDYINRLINIKENKYLDLKIGDNGVLSIGKQFNIGHLSEALNGYTNTKLKITDYLSKHNKLLSNKSLKLSIKELGLDTNKEFLDNALKTIFANNNLKISIIGDNLIFNITNSNLKVGNILSINYEYKGNKHTHEKYKAEINKAAISYGIPKGSIIQLIYHENGRWNPRLKAPGSSAYGLGQMVDGTWARFGVGNRNNPEDQLMATAKYMKYIKNKKNCSWEEVLAYYNTGLGIKKVSNINKYYNLNPAIARKQPSGIPRTNENYFIAAVAYYNDLSFNETKNKLKN